MKGVGSAPANSLTITLREKSRSDANRPSRPYGPVNRSPRRLGNIDRIVAAVVEHRVEESAVHVDRTGLVTGAGDEKPLIDVRAVVTGRTGDAQIAGRAAEDLGTVEQHVAVGDQRQVGFVDPLLFEIEHEKWQGVLIEDV